MAGLLTRLSSNCLVRGDQCVYPHRADGSPDSDEGSPRGRAGETSTASALVPASGTPPGLVPTAVRRRSPTPVDLAGSSVDPFETMEVDVPYKTDLLFHHCRLLCRVTDLTRLRG